MVFKNERSPFVAKSHYARNRRSSSLFVPDSPNSQRKRAKKKISNIKVVVRVRPFSVKESVGGGKSVVRVMDETVLYFDPSEQRTTTYFKGRETRDPTQKRNKNMAFAFDYVFNGEASNEQVYENTTQMTIDKLLDGINCSVFAYGSTGAGKTHTMVGNAQEPGVIIQTMVELYRRFEEMKDDVTCDVQVSYLEIYNETVRDLFRPQSGDLFVREDENSGVTVSHLSLHRPQNAEELLQMLAEGNRNRTQHPTDANKESSRSHAVFQVILEQRPKSTGIAADVLVSKMSLIDLAGSERAAATKNNAQRFREGANINRSLLALANCINALAEGKKGCHIPYRDSKLTRILKDSLGGTCQTIMIANVSPSTLSYEDTHNTLKYAERAKKIKTEFKKNVFHVDYHAHQYAQIVEKLKTELEEVKDKLRSAARETQRYKNRAEALERKKETAGLGHLITLCLEAEPALEAYVSIERDLLHQKNKIQEIETDMDNRERIQRHLESIDWDDRRKKTGTGRTERKRMNCQATKRSSEEKIERLEKGLKGTREDLLHTLSTAFQGEEERVVATPEIHFFLRSLAQQTERSFFKEQNAGLHSILLKHKTTIGSQEKLIRKLLTVVREQYLVMKGNGQDTSRTRKDMDEIVGLIEGVKEVAFQDPPPSPSPSPSPSHPHLPLVLTLAHLLPHTAPQQHTPSTAPESVSLDSPLSTGARHSVRGTLQLSEDLPAVSNLLRHPIQTPISDEDSGGLDQSIWSVPFPVPLSQFQQRVSAFPPVSSPEKTRVESPCHSSYSMETQPPSEKKSSSPRTPTSSSSLADTDAVNLTFTKDEENAYLTFTREPPHPTQDPESLNGLDVGIMAESSDILVPPSPLRLSQTQTRESRLTAYSDETNRTAPGKENRDSSVKREVHSATVSRTKIPSPNRQPALKTQKTFVAPSSRGEFKKPQLMPPRHPKSKIRADGKTEMAKLGIPFASQFCRAKGTTSPLSDPRKMLFVRSPSMSKLAESTTNNENLPPQPLNK